MAHSVIAPSSASIWGSKQGCTGWVKMAGVYATDEDTEASLEGSASHDLGEKMIRTSLSAGVGYPKREDTIGSITETGVVISEGIYDGSEMYANEVLNTLRDIRVAGGPMMGVEASVECGNIHEQSFGTVDAYAYSMESRVLYVWDYKFGFGIVEVFENLQLINYASGLLDQLGINGDTDALTTVVFKIIQPRAPHREGPVREWSVNAASLRNYFNQLSNKANEALTESALLHSGSHCKYCEALWACPTARDAGLGFMEVFGAVLPEEPTPDELGFLLSAVKRGKQALEMLEDAYEAQVDSLIRSGKPVNGWATEPTTGKKKWNKPITEVIALGQMLGKDLAKPQDAITPTQAIKLGLPEKVVNAYSVRPTTGTKIVPHTTTKAREVFSK